LSPIAFEEPTVEPLPRAREILDRGTTDCREIRPIERPTRLEVDHRELRVVVEHPLEAGHVPGAIRRAAMEGPREVIAGSPAHHLLEGERDVGLRGPVAGALREAKLGEQHLPRGDLLPRAEAAVARIARSIEARERGLDLRRRQS
jgi:hypothetical protein